jgi:hypothetical protein
MLDLAHRDFRDHPLRVPQDRCTGQELKTGIKMALASAYPHAQDLTATSIAARAA